MSIPRPHPVLVVDDEPNIRQFVARGLGSSYEVLTAADVAEAEVILREREVKVILCDDQMPGETGLMFLSRIRDQLPHTRRILLTGNGAQEALVFAINEAKAFRYLIKPAPVEEIRRLVADGVASYDQELATSDAAEEGVRLRVTVARHLHQPGQAEPAHRREGRVWLRLVSWGASGLAILFGLGVCVLLALYFMKSWLGIDFFENRHLRDWF